MWSVEHRARTLRSFSRGNGRSVSKLRTLAVAEALIVEASGAREVPITRRKR